MQELVHPNSSYDQPDPVLPRSEATVEAHSSPPKPIEEMLPPAIVCPRTSAPVMNNHPQKNKKRSKSKSLSRFVHSAAKIFVTEKLIIKVVSAYFWHFNHADIFVAVCTSSVC